METLLLNDGLLLAQGAARRVYRHPVNGQYLVKVFRQEYVDRKFGALAPWYKRSRRLGYLLAYQREWNEQYAAYLSHGGHPPYLQLIIGTVHTNFGLGQIVEAVRGQDGHFASTLYDLLQNGRFDDSAKRHLSEFFEWLLASPVVISELNTVNLLYRFDESLGNHFCIIDGIGDTNFIPIKSWFSVINRRNKNKWMAKMWHRLALWQARTAES